MLPAPDEVDGKGEYEDANGANGVEDIRNADCSCPGGHREDEDRREKIAGESKASKGIANNLCK